MALCLCKLIELGRLALLPPLSGSMPASLRQSSVEISGSALASASSANCSFRSAGEGLSSSGASGLRWRGSALCIVYSIIGVRVFTYLRTPLTYQLIYVAGDFSNMRSSLGAFVTGQLIFWILAGPLIFAAVSGWTTRNIGVPRGLLLRTLQGLALIGLVWQSALALRAWLGTGGPAPTTASFRIHSGR